MSVTILSIEPTSTANTWTIALQMGETVETFLIVREPVMIGDRQGWVLNATPEFYQRCQFNQHITQAVFQALRQMIQGEAVELPISVDRFYTPAEAQAEMVQRRGEALKIAK